MTKLDLSGAYAHLETLSHDDLAEWCYDSYKDFYGIKGRHMRGQGWTKLDYLDWIKCHFLWDYDAQGWRRRSSLRRIDMEVYMVSHGIQYEGADVVGVFSDYAKARECELKYVSEYECEYTEIRKVEVDKIYDNVFLGIGEEV